MTVFGWIETKLMNLFSVLYVRKRYPFLLLREYKGAKIWYPKDKETRKAWFHNCVAFAIGEDIYIRRKKYFKNKRLIRHEYTHVEQQRKRGLMFPILYWLEMAIVGYEENSFEKEARRAE